MIRTSLAGPRAVILLTVGGILAGAGATEARPRSISQRRALIGRLTPGDTPGFPVTISRSGSYVLQSNLTLTPGATVAIEITVDDVTLDLNGFSVLGPRTCPEEDNQVSSCLPAIEDPAIVGIIGENNVTIRNGTVQGMGGNGITLGNHARLEDVTVRWNSLFGVLLGRGSRVEGSTLVQNGQGAALGDFSLVTDSIIRLNTFAGLDTGSNTGYATSVISGGFFAVIGGMPLGDNVVCSGVSCP